MINELPVDQAILIYESEVRAGHLRDHGLLAGAVGAPYQHVFGTELFPTVVLKASKLIEGISRVQAYTNGNKRLAWHCGMALLEMNGLLMLEVDQDDAAQFVLNLRGDDSGLREGAIWLNSRVVSLE
ncbi:hypothetical protein KUV85_06775 [Nocardioides panacisoli]|uniref:type II toxin-antitoxin system death-on-curing family toxin n=1 Tax=Nocardioides panacisoli TaxID=627624 RepID=UPI001C62B188|nr:Fic family protein [Nocardioides panacisoli]QYJ05377.1 hypothetical protein KUV85_06775 [Nocardioides panacisoli]